MREENKDRDLHGMRQFPMRMTSRGIRSTVTGTSAARNYSLRNHRCGEQFRKKVIKSGVRKTPKVL